MIQLILTLLIFSQPTQGQEDKVLSRPQNQTQSKSQFNQNRSLFKEITSRTSLALSPLVGSAWQFEILPQIEALFLYEQIHLTSSSFLSTDDITGPSFAVRRFNKQSGLRYKFFSQNSHHFLLGGGYRWVELHSSHKPGLFDQKARAKAELQGAYTEILYRYRRPSSSWYLEVGATRGPGGIRQSKYVTTTQGFLGANEARLDVQYKHSYFPHFYVGYHF